MARKNGTCLYYQNDSGIWKSSSTVNKKCKIIQYSPYNFMECIVYVINHITRIARLDIQVSTLFVRKCKQPDYIIALHGPIPTDMILKSLPFGFSLMINRTFSQVNPRMYVTSDQRLLDLTSCLPTRQGMPIPRRF